MHHDLGTKASRAKIGVVFHTHYEGDDLATMQARAGADVKDSNDVFIIKNDTPMHKVGMSRVELNNFESSIREIERMCRECGDFLNELVDVSGTTGDDKFHVASYIKQFFNNEILRKSSSALVSASAFGILRTHLGANVTLSKTVRCGKRLNC